MIAKEKINKGITLIALVITIVVLLILAGVSVTLLWGENGILTQAEQGSVQYQIASAREKLDATLSNAQIQKRTNLGYDKVKFLNEFIKNNTANTKIIGNIVIVEGYAFNLDREVPKVGKYMGLESELAFDTEKPVIEEATFEPISKNSFTLTVTAHDNENKIARYELYINGVLEQQNETNATEYTFQIENKEIGKYNCTVKVYDEMENEEEIVLEARTKMYQWNKWDTKLATIYAYEKGDYVGSTLGNMSGAEDRLKNFTLTYFDNNTGEIRSTGQNCTYHTQLTHNLVIHTSYWNSCYRNRKG